MKTEITAKPYLGDRERPLVLMEIDLAARPTYSEFLPSPKNPWSPMAILSTAAEGSLRLMEDVTDMILGLPIRGYRSNRDPTTLLRMTGKIAGTILDVLPPFLWPLNFKLHSNRDEAELSIDQITLKQFRDAQRPWKACYQAIVSSRMGISRLNSCGLLGDLYLLRGDPSGGFTIRLHRYTAQPIIETLGLEIDSVEGGSEGARDEYDASRSLRNDAPIALIKPTFPFWTDVDLHYGKGKVICLRSESRWDNLQTKVTKPRGGKKNNSSTTTKTLSELPDYNVAQGLAVEPVTGPFRFPDLTLQVYPLLADRKALTNYVDKYLNVPMNGNKDAGKNEARSTEKEGTKSGTRLSFESFGSYVYLVFSSCSKQYGTMWSDTNNIGWWADKDVSFCVPVKVYQQNGDNKKQLISLALIAPFAYSNSGRAVITDREVNGRHAIKANITSPTDVWLGPRGPCSDRLVRLETQVFPALNVGQRSEMRTLLEITAEDPGKNEDIRNRLIAETWFPSAFDEDARLNDDPGLSHIEDAKALALELLTRENPFNFIYLKQIRDAEDPDLICYQAYVKAVRWIHAVLESATIDDNVYIRLHKYPDHNVRDALGLSPVRMDSEGDSVVYVLQPFNPFWIRAQVNEELSSVLCSRVSNEGAEWKKSHTWFGEGSNKDKWSDEYRGEPYFRSNYGFAAVGSLEQQVFPDLPSVWDEKTKSSTDNWLFQALIADINRIHQRIDELRKFQKPSPDAKGKGKRTANGGFQRFLDRLSDETANELSRSEWQTNKLIPKRSIKDLYWLVEELTYALRGDIPPVGDDKTYERLKRHNARRAIEELDDVMTLLKRILHDGIGRPKNLNKGGVEDVVQ
jgi:hypothetical protein